VSTDLRVDVARLRVGLGDWETPCVIGRSGACPAEAKREGDGCTPRGRWPLRAALLRPGRVAHPGALTLPWRWTRAGEGWSDDPADPAYNRPVALPRPFSAETMQRADQAYDVVLILGHNDAPPVPGRGSAIFLHLWGRGADGAPRATEGCVAIAPDAMAALLPRLTPGMAVVIG
jgi:L,D-peptidoglycan transpeptidase YkuD (ErfK/YbiS/YcfS/YnhG family)